MHALSAAATHNTAETQLVETAGHEFAYRHFGHPRLGGPEGER
jgi:hypothetical protein